MSTTAQPAAGDILARIVADKSEQVIAAQLSRPFAAVDRDARSAPAPRGFERALRATIDAGRPAVIAEIKKASPSRGVIRASFDPPAIAASYERAGAACLSVLTDAKYFQGADEYLAAARAACALPALRKEFILDEYQVAESRALGADAILLIVVGARRRAARGPRTPARATTASTCWSRCTTRASSTARSRCPTPLLGINNRNLRTFNVSLHTTIELLPRCRADRLVVTESGILAQRDVAQMRRHGVHAFLVGEAFMRAPDPGAALTALFG